MGIYDRDYQRGPYYGDSPGYHLGGPRTLTTKLVLVTGVIYLAEILSAAWFVDAFALRDDWYRQPWQVYQLLSYGFLHAPDDLKHILFNMFALWLFGRDVEFKYGRREFLAFYLAAIVVAGVVWTMAELVAQQPAVMFGASGGVVAVLILFAMNFPHRTVLFMFIIPMPMWVLACIIVGFDLVGALNRSDAGNVAYTAHLGGAAFGLLYYYWGGRLERWLPAQWSMPRFRRRPKLRVVDPYDEQDDSGESEVDEILRKIQQHGQDSLTRRERRILEKASREYQKKRQ